MDLYFKLQLVKEVFAFTFIAIWVVMLILINRR